jgi:hypothetical protein
MKTNIQNLEQQAVDYQKWRLACCRFGQKMPKTLFYRQKGVLGISRQICWLTVTMPDY